MSQPRPRIACVSYLNSRPLVEGLDQDPSIELFYDVPARLIHRMTTGLADVALLPVIDLLRINNPQIIESSGIGCDGPTLTVRLFSRSPLEETRRVAVDPDSHTSVVLSKIIFQKRFGLIPDYVALKDANQSPRETLLLIGDKVICDQPADMPFQLDLGQAWKELTGLPFVFAIWAARENFILGDVPQKLLHAKKLGLSNIESIIRDHALPRGWPADIARQYLTQFLNYNIGPKQLQAIALFHQFARDIDAV